MRKIVALMLVLGVLTLAVETPVHAQDAQSEQAAADSLSGGSLQGEGESLLVFVFSDQNRGFSTVLSVILLLGVFLVSVRYYNIRSEVKRGQTLYELDVRNADAEFVAEAVETESRHLLSQIFATMLNVFQTRGTAETLHEEVMNFIKQKQDEFGSFKLRIDFLSDTAGAIGLMGTVFGIISVFGSEEGLADKDVVLNGMGVALVSTLVGLVVSLILNLLATELNTYFDRVLERATDKADLLRFRLMELTSIQATPAVPSRGGGLWGDTSTGSGIAMTSLGRKINPGVRQTSTGSRGGQPSDLKGKPAKVVLITKIPDVPAGAKIKGLKFKVLDYEGQPVEGAEVEFSSGGTSAPQRMSTDAQGVASFEWSVGSTPGRARARVVVAGSDAVTTIDAVVKPAKPEKVVKVGNNQSASAGSELPKPIGLVLSTKNGGPVAGHQVEFIAKDGNGRFGESNGQSLKTTTDEKGQCNTSFILGSSAGLNQVVARVEGMSDDVKFQLMGTES